MHPPGIDAPGMPDRAPADPPGAPRGSCLCGEVTYVVDAPILRSRTCHCSRCRKAASAAHVSYVVTKDGGVRFTRGAELREVYRVPEAKYFEHAFCRACGSSLPRTSPARGIDIVPMGTLDDDPGARPTSHIFVGSKAPWDAITDALPQHDEHPPS